jgi:hypothetical protein
MGHSQVARAMMEAGMIHLTGQLGFDRGGPATLVQLEITLEGCDPISFPLTQDQLNDTSIFNVIVKPPKGFNPASLPEGGLTVRGVATITWMERVAITAP